jgi:hypothetical protein
MGHEDDSHASEAWPSASFVGTQTGRSDMARSSEEMAREAKENDKMLATCGDIVLCRKSIHRYTDYTTHMLDGVTAEMSIMQGPSKRVTLTRMAMFGAFALAMPKGTDGVVNVEVRGNDFVWNVPMQARDMKATAEFVDKVNDQAEKFGSWWANLVDAATQEGIKYARDLRNDETITDREFCRLRALIVPDTSKPHIESF